MMTIGQLFEIFNTDSVDEYKILTNVLNKCVVFLETKDQSHLVDCYQSLKIKTFGLYRIDGKNVMVFDIEQPNPS